MVWLILAYDWLSPHEVGKAWKSTTIAISKGVTNPLWTGLLVSNAWIQLKIEYWRWFWRQWCRDVASGADGHLDITFGLQVVESSSLVSVLFREAFSHPYISFFHLLIIIIKHFFRRVFSEYTEANGISLIPLDTNFPEICAFINGFRLLCGLKWGPCWLIN